MDSKDVELLEWCQGLGQMETRVDDATGEESQHFQPGPEAIVCLKGLESMLRRDSSELQSMHLRLGTWHTVRTHLLPLLYTCCKKKQVVYQCVKVLARITMPLSSIVENKVLRLEHLQETKSWFLEGDYMTTLVWIMSKALEQHPSVRNDEDRNLMEMLLTLFKNLLAIPDPITDVGEYQKKLHDRCIVKMQETLVFDTLSVLATTIDSKTDTATKYLLQDCFVHVFRQERNAEELFMEEEEERKLLEAQKQQSKPQSTHSSADASGAVPVPSNSLGSQASFVNSEAARLSRNLNASLQATRDSERALRKSGMARHARFGSKYSIRVMPDPKNSLVVEGAAAGMNSNVKPPTSTLESGVIGRADTLFAPRLVRNPFAAPNKMINDSLPGFHGRKPALGTSNRVFLNPNVKQSLHATAVSMLDSGGWNTLCKAMLRELETSATKDVVVSDDAKNFLSLNGFFMAFQRIRSKRLVRAGEKKQKAKEEAEFKLVKEQWNKTQAEEEKKKKEHEKQMALLIPPTPTRPNATVALLEGGSMLSEELPSAEMAHSSSATQEPARFPNAINSEGQFSFATTQSATQADLDDMGIDESFLPTTQQAAGETSTAQPNAAAAVPAAVVAPTKPSGPVRPPFIRQVVYDASSISASLSLESWKYLHTRIKLYLEDRPTPWPYLAAAISMYKELLRSLYEMHSCGSTATRLKADQMRRTLFYDKESIELFGNLLQNYSSSNTNMLYLSDLITAAHYQMKLLEDLAQPGAGHVVLEKRRRIVRRKKEKIVDLKKAMEVAKAKAIADNAELDAMEMKEKKKLKEAVSGEKSEDETMEPGAAGASPSASSTASSGESKKSKAKRQLFDEEMELDEEGAPSTLFPPLNEDEEEQAIPSEGESSPGKSVSKQKKSSEEEEQAAAAVEGGEGAAAPAAEGEDSEYEDVEIEEEGPSFARKESEFEYEKFFARFCHNAIMQSYLHGLTQYRTNQTEVNYMILVFFQRVTKAHMNGFFFQLRAFILFESILTDEWVKSRPVYDDLRKWIKDLIRQFIDFATKKLTPAQQAQEPNADVCPNRHFWIELLFWKNFVAADRLLNENGWFDQSKDRARSIREAEILAERYGAADEDNDWVDIDSEEEEEKLAIRRADELKKEAGEAEASLEAWVDSEGLNRKNKSWTKGDEEILMKGYQEFKDQEAVFDILHSLLPLRSQQSIKEKLKKMGILEKRIRSEKSSKKDRHSSSGSSDKKKKKLTLADILDRHDSYNKVASIDETMESIRELIIDVVHKDCRSTMALLIEQFKLCRDARAKIEESNRETSATLPEEVVMEDTLQQIAPYPFQAEDGLWDHDAMDEIGQICRIIGIPDDADKEGSWTIPKHFASTDLTAYIELLESTLDSPSSSRARADELENDAEIARLLNQSKRSHKQRAASDDDEAEHEFGGATTAAAAAASSPSTDKPTEEGEEAAVDAEEEQRRLEKAAKRARREERERREALELAESSQSSLDRPRRRRAEAIAADRARIAREAEERRRELQRMQDAEDEAAEQAAENQFQGSTTTVMGATAVAAAKQAEANPTHFSKTDLNDFMALKRQRGLQAMAEREKRLEEEFRGASQPTSGRKRSNPVSDESPAKQSKLEGKKRLIRRAADSDEEEEEQAQPDLSQAEPEEAEQPSGSTEDVPESTADMDVSMNDEDDADATTAPSPARAVTKKKARRVLIDSDDDDEADETGAAEEEALNESRAEGEEAHNMEDVPADTAANNMVSNVPVTITEMSA